MSDVLDSDPVAFFASWRAARLARADLKPMGRADLTQASLIGFVTPAQHHDGMDKGLLEQRALDYGRARQENPQRWSGQPRQ